MVAGLLNILALAFTIAFSSFLLLYVNWAALHSECIVQDTCDIISVALYSHPLQGGALEYGCVLCKACTIRGCSHVWLLPSSLGFTVVPASGIF